ncbi:MAG: hypothetical protein RL318_910 [Fibrobacterota bacterium]|jgi:uncharacterized protein (TIGR02147 family)
MATAAPKAPKTTLSIFDYGDYHKFLFDWVEEQKARNKKFSFQHIADSAGFKSRSFLHAVTSGKRDISLPAAVKLSKFIGFNRRESEFFELLVAFNNAKTLEEKNHFLEKLAKVSKPSPKAFLSAQQYDLFNKWFIIPIWELVTFVDFGDDYKLLGQKLIPPVTPTEARYAVELLLNLGLIEKVENLYVQKESNLHTADEIYSQAIKNYQVSMLQMAIEALDRIKKENRNISTLTLGTNLEGVEAVRERIHEFRGELSDIAAKYAPSDCVYQVNIQFFPLAMVGPG